MGYNPYTKEQEKWLIEHYDKFDTYRDLTDAFNLTFGTGRKPESIREKCNKSLKLKGMQNPTRFKPGNKQEQCPIGTIRSVQNVATYIKVKDNQGSHMTGYAEPYWLPIQKKIWQDYYGEVPEGHMIVFLDSNNKNLDINNLYCIDRKILAVMNSNKWFTTSREHTLTAIKWCELFYAMKGEKR